MKECPMLKNESWDCECKNVSRFYCPVAAMPWMIEAINNEWDDCPLSWQLDNDLHRENRG